MNETLPSYRHAFPSMGSTVEILLVSHNAAEQEALTTFGLAERLAAEWERTFSRFTPESEISRLNARAGRPVPVSELLYAAIEIALDGSRLTGGLFDPTILRALAGLGYDRTFDEIADDGRQWLSPTPAPGIAGIRLGPEQRVVTLPSNTHIDLGGVVKGLYVDMLAGSGSWVGGAISAGGDLRVWGIPPTGDRWIIGVEDADDPSRDAAQLHLDRGAVATSGTNRRAWRRGGVLLHHLIDPRTGLPAERGIRTASVFGATAVQAEIAATALVVGGLEDPVVRSLIRQAVVILDDGEIVTVRDAMGGQVDVINLTSCATIAA
ncbi:MAG TPA: FAD:protein FMN transferase [Nitrolancea sp.]